ncbi:hypothetical protein M758_6G049400 [Ceratodon purpureus]|nr:hypothetical protein M758_6G049400 [Ceratodon purpureus]
MNLQVRSNVDSGAVIRVLGESAWWGVVGVMGWCPDYLSLMSPVQGGYCATWARGLRIDLTPTAGVSDCPYARGHSRYPLCLP